MPRTPGLQRSQAKDMYWFAHGGIESAMNQLHPVRSTTPGLGGDTEDDSSESGSLSLKANSERRATSEEPVSLKQSCDQQDNVSNAAQRLNFSDKRQAVEERKRLLLEAEQEKNDAILKKHIEREAAYEARRNAQHSNISFAFGSTVSPRQSDVDGGKVQLSPDCEKHKMSPPTTLYTLPPKTDLSQPVEFFHWKPMFSNSNLTESGLSFADVMSQSMFSPTGSARGRRKNDLTPTIPYDRTGPPRTAPPTRKRSVSMSRLDQLAQPRKAYVEAQKANSTISNSSSKGAHHSPTRPLSVASEKLSGVSKTALSTVSRRPPAASRKPRPVSIAGTIPDNVSQPEGKALSKITVQNRKHDAPVSNVKTHTSHLRTRAKSSSTERTSKPAKSTEKQTPPPKSPSPTKPKKPSTSKSSKHSTPKLSSSPKQWTPKTSPARKLLTNKKQAAILVSTNTEGTANTFGEIAMFDVASEKYEQNHVANYKNSPIALQQQFLANIDGMCMIFDQVCGTRFAGSHIYNDFMKCANAVIHLFENYVRFSMFYYTQPPSPIRSNTPDEDSQSADERSSGKKIISEEEAKASLAEKRRFAREQAEKEAELERQRQKALKQEEEEKLRLEEEEHKRMEEEQLRMLEEHQKFEEEKLRKAIEEQERKEEEEKTKREEEARMKAEQEKKAKEEAEKQRIELEEKLKKEEEERAERKKRLEKIMSRTRGKSGTASPGSASGSEAPDSTESQPEILSSEPNSLDSNIAVESLPMDNPQAEEPSGSDSYDYNRTMNLDSQSLSSNDLMMPSSGHTSLDGSIPMVASGHPSLEAQPTPLQPEDISTRVEEDVAESEGEEVSSSSTQPVTELVLEKTVSDNAVVGVTIVDQGTELVTKDEPPAYGQEMKTSIEDDTLISSLPIDPISEFSILGLHDNQRSNVVMAQGEEFGSSFANESKVVDDAVSEMLRDSEPNIEYHSSKVSEYETASMSDSDVIAIEKVVHAYSSEAEEKDHSVEYAMEEQDHHSEETHCSNLVEGDGILAGDLFEHSNISSTVEASKQQDPPFLQDSLPSVDKPSSVPKQVVSDRTPLEFEPCKESHVSHEIVAESEFDLPTVDARAQIADVESFQLAIDDKFTSNVINDNLESIAKEENSLLTESDVVQNDKLEQHIVEQSFASPVANTEESVEFTPAPVGFVQDDHIEEIPPPFQDTNVTSGSDHGREFLVADKSFENLQVTEQESQDPTVPKQGLVSPSNQFDELILLPDPMSDPSSLSKIFPVEHLPPPNVVEQASPQHPDFDVNESDISGKNALNSDQNVLAEASPSMNPFASNTLSFPSQPFESNCGEGLERFADHGVLKTVDEMNFTNLEETNKNVGFLFSYAEEEVPVDTAFSSQKYEADITELPLDFQENLPGQTLLQGDVDQSYGTVDADMSLFVPKFDEEKHKDFATEAPDSFSVLVSATEKGEEVYLPQRTLNPFGNVPEPVDGGFLSSQGISEQVLSDCNASNLANELLMNALNSAIDESEDSSLDSNLSQVLNVETTEPTAASKSEQKDHFHSKLDILESSPSATDAKERDTCDTQQFSNSVMQHDDLFIPKTNGYNATYNNSCLYGDRFESAEFGADQIPVLPKDLEQSHPISENGMNANISTVGNGNTLDNVDNVNSNKITSNPFLISSDTRPFSGNPF